MPRAFSEIAFTPAVRAFQSRMGSRGGYAALDDDEERGNALTPREAEFIAARDGFYQATVGEGGWPYVQFRGGPVGFLRVLDERTIGYADFRGNVQYISAGNLSVDDRVAIILMDYAARRRLKIWGRARLVDASRDRDLIGRLEMPAYRARVERAVVITVEAFDWNCPQHITPRFTEAEIAAKSAPLHAEIARLRNANAGSPGEETLGAGPLPLVIRGIRDLAPRVRAFELRRADGGELPAIEPGAHLDVPVRLANGVASTRRYSLMTPPDQRNAWEIAVLREAGGSGGSAGAHRDFRLGLVLHAATPGNDFEMHRDARPSVLVAGGIGITPLRAMARALAAQGRDFHLHYAGSSARDMAYREELSLALGPRFTGYAADEGRRLDLARLFDEAPANAVFYFCGPPRLLDAARKLGALRGVDAGRMRMESFVPAPRAGDRAVELELRRSGRILQVPATQSLLDAVNEAGIDVASGCRTGTCGTCATKVLEGVPEHRDHALSDAERERAGLMCPCVSRAASDRLALDL